MMTIIARYSIDKLIVYIVVWFLVCSAVLAYPYIEYGGVGAFMENSRMGFFAPVGIFCCISMIIFNMLFALNVSLRRGVALYTKDGSLSSSAPFISSIKLNSIVDVYLPNESMSKRIAIKLNSGAIKYISVRLFREDGADVKRAICSLASLDRVEELG